MIFFIGVIIFSLSDPCYIDGNRSIQYCSVTYKILSRTLKQWNPNVILLLKIFMNCMPKTHFASTKKKNRFSVAHIYMGIVHDNGNKIPTSFLMHLM